MTIWWGRKIRNSIASIFTQAEPIGHIYESIYEKKAFINKINLEPKTSKKTKYAIKQRDQSALCKFCRQDPCRHNNNKFSFNISFNIPETPSPFVLSRENQRKKTWLRNQKELHPREPNILRFSTEIPSEINNEQIRNSAVSMSNHFHESEMPAGNR